MNTIKASNMYLTGGFSLQTLCNLLAQQMPPAAAANHTLSVTATAPIIKQKVCGRLWCQGDMDFATLVL